MKKWKINKLIDVARVIRGVTFDKGDVSDLPSEGFVPILRAGNIGDKLDTKNDLVYVPAYKVGKDQLLQVGDVAICMSSGSSDIVGKTSKLEEKWNGSVGAFCAIIRFTQDVLPKFGAIYFQSRAFISWRKQQAEGANIKNIRKSDLESLMLPVPPLAEQEHIVRILDEAEDMKRLRVQSNNRTTDLIPALFDDMFGDILKNSKKWQKKNLGECGVKIRYGLGQPPEEADNGVAMIRATNISNGVINPQGILKVRREAIPINRKPFLKTGDVIVVRSGVYTGDVAFITKEWEGAVAGYDLVVSPSDQIDGSFLTWQLLSPKVQQIHFANEKNRAAQSHLNAEQLGNTPIIVPPLQLQKKFAERVEEIRALELDQFAAEKKLESLFQSLLQRAFEGEL